jgi:hypothetical protein
MALFSPRRPAFARDGRLIGRLFAEHRIEPVLLDIGASGPPRDTWNLIAPQATFIGFDPDLRELRELTGTGFRRATLINKAVTASPEATEVQFHLTQNPYCSSTLEPDLESLREFAYVDYFRVERTATAPATNLPAVLAQLGLPRIDWFKSDSQGTDLRLFMSLPPAVRDQVLCVELEPGLIDAYRGEDLFAEAHRELTRQGFWLAEANLGNAVRMRPESIAYLQQSSPAPGSAEILARCPEAPAWVEATYLRGLPAMQQGAVSLDRYILLWTFAVMRGQWGFALDAALAARERFGPQPACTAMIAPLEAWLRTAPALRRPPGRWTPRRLLPAPLKRLLRALLRR